jgi:MYXO-CTERM domain-containing protein
MRNVVAPLTALSLLLASISADASEWHHGDGVAHAGSPEDAAQAFIGKQLAGVDLVYRNTIALAGSHHTVRFTQRHGGLPVLGGSSAIMVAPDGSIRVAVFDVARDLNVSTTPTVAVGDAHMFAETRHGAGARKATARSAFKTELAVLRDGGGKLVWVVDMPSSDGGWRYLVDANSGGVLRERAMATHATGRVYSISSVVTPTAVDLELLDMTPSTPQLLNGWNGNLTVTNYVSGDPNGMGAPMVLEQTLEPSAGEDFLYDPPADATDPTDAFAQVNLYHHLTRSRDFFRDVLLVDSAPTSWELVAAANVQESGQPMNNAFFSPMGVGAPWNAPNLIAIGQGSVDFAYDSDVFIHEFGHYVSHNAVGYNQGQTGTSEWGLSPWGGAIDEGISDYFACTLNGDSTLGEASLANLGGARDLTDTSKVCPDDVFGEVHADGEMIGSLSWSIREAVGATAADQLVWGAVSLLTATTSLGDYARALQTTAETLEGTLLTAEDLTTIDNIIAARGFDACDEELPLSQDAPITTQMVGFDLLGQAFGADCGTIQAFGIELSSYFHFRVTPDAADQAVRFLVDFGSATGNLSWNIYVRVGEHVGMEPGGGPFPLPVAAVYDYAVEDITLPTGEIVIDEFSDPPFDPSASYHMVIGQQNCPNVTAIVSTNAVPGEPVGGEGGAGGAGGMDQGGPIIVDDGCGCEAVGANSDRSYGAWAALMLGAFAMRRRRR